MIHNISIATLCDVIILSDDVSIYSVDLFKKNITLNTVSVGYRNAIISSYDFFHLFVFHFGNSFMATESILKSRFCSLDSLLRNESFFYLKLP